MFRRDPKSVPSLCKPDLSLFMFVTWKYVLFALQVNHCIADDLSVSDLAESTTADQQKAAGFCKETGSHWGRPWRSDGSMFSEELLPSCRPLSWLWGGCLLSSEADSWLERMSPLSQNKFLAFFLLCCALTCTTLLFSFTFSDPPFHFLKYASRISGSFFSKDICACDTCMADVGGDAWLADRFNQSILPLMTRDNSALSDDTYRWWQVRLKGLRKTDPEKGLILHFIRFCKLNFIKLEVW